MTRYPGRPAWTTTVAPAAASALVLLLAGCGGSSGKSTSASAPSSAANGGGDATKAYTECLRENGVAVPTGRPDGGNRPSGEPRPSGESRPFGEPRPSGRPSRPAGERPTAFPSGRPNPRATDPAYRKAEEACAKLRPSRGPAGGGGAGGGTDAPRRGGNSAGQAFAGCLKDHQVELPPGGAPALDRNDPKTAEALKICEPLLPSTPGTATTPTPTAPPAGATT
ncbi:hypothetical protein ACIBSV_29845 [Embleya sp. NPDC050154]|uniref:hypothetical protein n=1 Tax=Embleya sp. NPDC050154 TaxID=3363988 RepID=UPI0037A7E6AB